jgi:hypothetical protein
MRVPPQWATTENHLGTALWTLGERQDSVTYLQAAHEAVRGAYEVDVIEAGLTQYDGYYRARLAELEERIAALKAEPVASD